MRTRHLIPRTKIAIPGGEGSSALPTAFIGKITISLDTRYALDLDFKIAQKLEHACSVVSPGNSVICNNRLPSQKGVGGWLGTAVSTSYVYLSEIFSNSRNLPFTFIGVLHKNEYANGVVPAAYSFLCNNPLPRGKGVGGWEGITPNLEVVPSRPNRQPDFSLLQKTREVTHDH